MAALPVISLVAGIAGAGISAAGAYETGQANSATMAYQSQVAANNAAIARQNAELAMQSGEQQVGISQMKTRAAVGATKAGQGASGVDVNSGSSTSVRAGEAELGMLDALTIRSNAAKSAYGYEVQGTSDTAQSQLYEAGSKQASTAGDIGALGTFIGGIGSVGAKYAAWQNVGGPPINSAVNTGAVTGNNALDYGVYGAPVIPPPLNILNP